MGQSSKNLLGMLTDVEALLEDLVAGTSSMPYDFVMATEKALDKQRRDKSRAERKREEQHKHEERLQRAIMRARMPVTRRPYKKVMHRSRPPDRRRKLKKETIDNMEKSVEERFFT